MAQAKPLLETLAVMESTGGEPDVIGEDADGRVICCDHAPQSPGARRNRCSDRALVRG